MAKAKLTPIDPVAYFAQWAYIVIPSAYVALGVTFRRSIRPSESAWKLRSPPDYSFHEGDFFRKRDGADAVQIVRIAEKIEAHLVLFPALPGQKNRTAYLLEEDGLASWLQTGHPPASAFITPDMSSSEVFRYSLKFHPSDPLDPASEEPSCLQTTQTMTKLPD